MRDSIWNNGGDRVVVGWKGLGIQVKKVFSFIFIVKVDPQEQKKCNT